MDRHQASASFSEQPTIDTQSIPGSIYTDATVDDRQLVSKLVAEIGRHPLGYVSAPSTSNSIAIDILPLKDGQGSPRVMGELIITEVREADTQIFAIGQVVEVTTRNQWHENITFKGVIKEYGTIPHLSGQADIRTATVTVQSAFRVAGKSLIPHVLGTSPTTGRRINLLTNATMKLIMQDRRGEIIYLGKAYGADVSIPFWLRHFSVGSSADRPSSDAYHIGVFGKTGSGKTVMAAMMLLGYGKHRSHMSFLILDPQSQFYNDRDLLPDNHKFADEIQGLEMRYQKIDLTKDVYLDSEDLDIAAGLLAANGFLKNAFSGSLGTPEKQEAMADLIERWIYNNNNQPRFLKQDPKQMLMKLLSYLSNEEKLKFVYVQRSSLMKLQEAVQCTLERLSESDHSQALIRWRQVISLFQKSNTRKMSLRSVVDQVINEPGNCIVLGLQTGSQGSNDKENEKLQALFIKLVQRRIVELAEKAYTSLESGQRPVNALIVMDEAHRFASSQPYDPMMREVSSGIVDAVRTTRKYGVGYMFVTQSLDSLHQEIIRQMRVFGFGYGLTTGTEFRRLKEIINHDPAANLYRSFIDPGSNNQYPFMFYGPISPLSFTGAPIFIEAYSRFGDIRNGLKGIVRG